MKNRIPYFLCLVLPFVSPSCGTEAAVSPRALTSSEIKELRKDRPYTETEKRQIKDYRDEVGVIAVRQWKFYIGVWNKATKSESAHLAFVLSPKGKVEAISTLKASDPEYARVSTQAILHCAFPPQPRHLSEILKDDRMLFEGVFELKDAPKRRVILKDGLLIYE